MTRWAIPCSRSWFRVFDLRSAPCELSSRICGSPIASGVSGPGADGRTFLGARHWDDDGSVQRHLRFVSEPLPLARRRPHGASGPSERTRRGLVAWNHWSAAQTEGPEDRKSTRLNSSHVAISYAVFCLK